MKTWNTPELAELDLKNTEHEWKIQPSLDGGYLGDGKLSGWFGPADGNAQEQPATPSIEDSLS